jgi:hypothetical protein
MLCILFLCLPFLPPPGPIVPDGAGGFVPFTQSRVRKCGTACIYCACRLINKFPAASERPQGHKALRRIARR